MKVYLDNSVLNRPFDNQSAPEIRLETIAFFIILDLIEKNEIQLANSSIIEYENSKNPYPDRKKWIEHYLSRAVFYQKIDLKIRQRAIEIKKFKISPLDALHLASAEKAKVDCFITCDYDIIKKYQGEIKTLSPVNFIQLLKTIK